MSLTIGEIARIVSGRLLGPEDRDISGLIIDNRKVTSISPSTLFVALKGSRRNGEEFIDSLYQSGVRAFLVSSDYDVKRIEERFSEASFVISGDSLDALQKIAKHIRDQFNGTLIAITGSNGKTIVKEWFSDILEKSDTVLRSPRSYNSQTGVPLSVWGLNNTYNYGVFEAGMSMPGEIEKLEKILRPDIGVFTNIGDAHQENFQSMEEKISEKLKLFINCKTIIYSPDQDDIKRAISESDKFKGAKLFTWSFKDKDSDFYFSTSTSIEGSTLLNLSYNKADTEYKLPYSDRASIQNSALVIVLLKLLKLDADFISEQIMEIKPVAMRMEQKEGINGCTLIDDYYNSDPAALGIALDYLKQVPTKRKRVIISDFVQQAGESRSVYSEVAQMITKAGVTSTICVGEELLKNRKLFNSDTLFFRDTDELLRWFTTDKFENEVILLKGARKFKFERLSTLLELKAHITKLEINLNNLQWNLNKFRQTLSGDTLIMAMVKAFAYGAGPRQISEWLVKNGVDFLTVAYADEGVSLRESGIGARIMVMNPDPASFSTIIANDLEPEIFSFELLHSFNIELEKSGIDHYPVHIKIDTGMHRLGFTEGEIESLCSFLKKKPALRVASLFSHLAASEDPKFDMQTRKQADLFVGISSEIERVLDYKVLRHLLNSAGTLRFPEYQFDMVRLGIGLFGCGFNDIQNAKAVASFRTSVSQVKLVRAGEGIGYGFEDSTDRDRQIATLPVGYADGLNRKLGNGRGKVYINSRLAAIVGNVCMDMCMVDVSGMDVKSGDSVEIFGENISVSSLALACETIPYEIITGISSRVKRVYLFD